MIKKKISMPSFKVLHVDYNSKQLEFCDVVPYLIDRFNDKFRSKKSLQTLLYWGHFVQFILSEAMYIWWSRCEYECLIMNANQTKRTKIDWYQQIQANIDTLSYEIYRYLRTVKKEMPQFSFKPNEIYENRFYVLFINPKTKEADYHNIIPYLMEYFLQRYDNKHYNFKNFAELQGLVSNALEEEYLEDDSSRILVTDWPNEKKILETNSFEIAFQNIDMLCRVFYANYEYYFKNSSVTKS